MAFAPSTLSSTPRGVTCAEIGIVAKIAAANSRPMTDQAFIVFLLVFNATKDDHSPTIRTAIPGKSGTSIHQDGTESHSHMALT
jgi:hypothetical protein